MERKWFNSMLFNRGLEYRCGLSKSIDSFGPIENNSSVNEDPSSLTDIENNSSVNEDPSSLTDIENNIHSWKNNSENSSYSYSYSYGDYLVDVSNIQNLLSDKTFLVRDSNNSYSIDFAIENQILEIDNNHSFFNEPESFFASYLNYSYLTNVSKSNDPNYIEDTQSNWNNNITSSIESYLRYLICIDSDILDDSDNYNDNISDVNSYISDETNDSDFTAIENSNNTNKSEFVRIQYPADPKDTTYLEKFQHLWVQCESCFKLNFKAFLKSKMYICEYCGFYLKMTSSHRIELLIDPGTWNPMDEDMFSLDPIEFDKPYPEDEPSTDDEPSTEEESSTEDQPSTEDESSTEDQPSTDDEPSTEEESSTEDEPSTDDEPSTEDQPSTDDEPSTEEESSTDDEPYIDRLDFYQETTGLLEAVQTGTGQLNGIPVAIGIMDFHFIGGSMGSVVGEKITRLIEYATNEFLPLIIVCASGGARMQEGSLSLMQMAKISSALYNYQINEKLFYVAILTSPTTGGVTASFGMLGDIIIAEPKAYLAFAGKRVIEETLKTEVPEGSQSAEVFFENGLLDSIVSRDSLKGFISELLELHFHEN